jgi:hypothetical protein
MFTSISMKSLITSITTERTGARSRQAVGCHPVTAPLCGEAPAPAAPVTLPNVGWRPYHLACGWADVSLLHFTFSHDHAVPLSLHRSVHCHQPPPPFLITIQAGGKGPPRRPHPPAPLFCLSRRPTKLDNWLHYATVFLSLLHYHQLLSVYLQASHHFKKNHARLLFAYNPIFTADDQPSELSSSTSLPPCILPLTWPHRWATRLPTP